MNNLALIPARSGSKGLVDKNIKTLNGKPLIAYTIAAAINSGIYDEVYVSTDSEYYATIAREYGAQVPFLRSSENSTDIASSWDVVREALQKYQDCGKTFDMVSLLQPTTPLRTDEDIRNAYKLLIERNVNAVVSVCEVDHSPLWCNTLPEDHSMCNFIKSDKQRQKLDTYYRINGAIYMVNTQYFQSCKSIYDKDCIAYVMDKQHSIDIDDENDFALAQFYMQLLEHKGC